MKAINVRITTVPGAGPKGAMGVRITDANTGAEIKGVRSCQIFMDVDEAISAILELYPSELDITTGAQVMTVCPKCKEVI